MIFAFFLASLSTRVHNRLQITFRTVPYGQLSTHGRSVSHARPRSPHIEGASHPGSYSLQARFLTLDCGGGGRRIIRVSRR
jgi:hypothetical protein